MPNKTKPLQAVERTFLILETLAENGPMTFIECHEKLQLNKASLSRIVNTLLSTGYVIKNEENNKLSLSLKFFALGASVTKNYDYLSFMRIYLEDLSKNLNVTAQFSVPFEDGILCIESYDYGNNQFSIYTRVGQKSPIYATSAGKAILSTFSNDEILDKIQDLKMESLTPNTITNKEDLLKDIGETRKRGYALDDEENELNLFCLGVPVLNYNGSVLGAISLSSDSMDEEKIEVYSRELLKKTKEISSMLGFSL